MPSLLEQHIEELKRRELLRGHAGAMAVGVLRSMLAAGEIPSPYRSTALLAVSKWDEGIAGKPIETI
jgi:hypothetical protein